MFLDEVTITVRSGAGGKGCDSYHKRSDHKRIPNGGDGGDGGDVILVADSQTGSLFPLKSKRIFEAEEGGFGSSNKKHGRKGKDCIVKVPCGTTIFNKQDNLLIRDLLNIGDHVVVLSGGKGGYGNHAGYEPSPAGQAKELELLLSFKIIADVFLVGLPNSGKTTLLKRLTGAGISETEYPFATKAPQLGTYRTNFSQFHLCELPAIYRASEEGRGLGTHFLKHLARAKLILFMLDPKSEFAENLKDGFNILLKTVENFNSDLLEIPRFIAVNKSDLISAKDKKVLKLPAKEKVFFISSKEGTGIDQLMKAAGKVLGISHETAVR